MDELALLTDVEKREIADLVLGAVGVSARSVSRKGEIKIPCTISDYHSDQDKHPTGALNYKKMVYNCLGCQAGGTVLWYIAENLGFGESRDSESWLRKEAGLKDILTSEKLLMLVDSMCKESPPPPPIPKYAPRTLLQWLKPDFWYFAKRDIPLANALKFMLGYNEEEHRIVIPHFFMGELVGWQTRTVDGSGEKYKNSTDFPRESTLFNYKPGVPAVLMESTFSVMRHVGGDFHLEASFGTNVTEDQIKLLERHPRVILWMDNDKPGWKATRSLIQRLSRTTDVWVVPCPYWGDPGDLPSYVVNDLLSRAVPAVLWEGPGKLVSYV